MEDTEIIRGMMDNMVMIKIWIQATKVAILIRATVKVILIMTHIMDNSKCNPHPK